MKGIYTSQRCTLCLEKQGVPDSKIHGANVGPTWGRQDPGGPHAGHMNLAIWGVLKPSFRDGMDYMKMPWFKQDKTAVH